MGEKFSSTELSVSTVVDETDVTIGVGVTFVNDRMSIDGNVSISVVDDCVVAAAVLADGIVVVIGISVVTDVDNSVVDVVGAGDVDTVTVVVVVAVVGCSIGAGCNIIGAGIMT